MAESETNFGLWTVNNAGAGAFGPATKASKEEIDSVFGANVYAPLFMMQATVPVMPSGGRIINIGSIASKLGVAPIPLYDAAKAAQDALTFAMAMEVSKIILQNLWFLIEILWGDNG
jgi:NAD(P)-dependent dehydrogenase (short-subunit alcohol dehydrogenase family)